MKAEIVLTDSNVNVDMNDPILVTPDDGLSFTIIGGVGPQGEKGEKGDRGDPTDVILNGASLVSEGVANLTPLQEKIDALDFAEPILRTVSGTVASFNDGSDGAACRSIVVTIDPVQDLHGYDHPWPAGGSKNLLNNKASSGTHSGVTFTVNSDGSVTVKGTSTSTIAFILDAACPLPGGSYVVNGGVSGSAYINISGKVNSYGPDAAFTMEEDGTTNVRIFIAANVTVNDTFFPMIRKSTETDSSFVPYENSCPISGWTGIKIVRTGKNLFNGSFVQGGISTINGEFNSLAGSLRVDEKILVAPGDYRLSWSGSRNMFGFTYKRDGAFSRYVGMRSVSPALITINEDERYFAFYQYNDTEVPDGLRLEYGQVSTEYEAYAGETYDITFPSEVGTVYGGKLDVTNGVLTVDRVIASMNGDPAVYAYPATWYANDVEADRDSFGAYWYWHYKGMNELPLPDMTRKNEAISSTFRHRSWGAYSQTEHWIFGIQGSAESPYIAIRIPKKDLSDTSSGQQLSLSVMEYLRNNPFTFCYVIAKPMIYHLTPMEITTLLGKNHICADAGDIEVSYKADTKTYVDANGNIRDIQVNGMTVIQDGVANIPLANTVAPGVAKVISSNGITLVNGALTIYNPGDTELRQGANAYRPITPNKQHAAAFYGLAKAAGDTTQASSTNTVGIYTAEAREAIAKMLGIPLWHRVELTQNNYDESLGMFILDVGEENEIRDVRVTGQAVWDEGFAAGSAFNVGFGKVPNRSMYTDFAVAKNVAAGKRLYLGAAGTCMYNSDTQRVCFGYGFSNVSSYDPHALHIDNYASVAMQGRQTAVYHNFNQSRYFHIVAPTGVSWAHFAVEYTLM